MDVFQEGGKPVKLPIFLVAFKGINFVEVIRLKQSCYGIILYKTKLYIDDDNIINFSTKSLNIFKIIGLIDSHTVLPI